MACESKPLKWGELTPLEELWTRWDPLLPDVHNLSETIQKTSLNDHKKPLSEAEVAARELRKQKLHVYRDAISFYNQDSHHAKFNDFYRDLHTPAVQKYDLAHRIKTVEEGKQSANEKYKEGNWKGALYTYAVAWGLLLPFDPAALDAKDPVRKTLGTLELALMSNISAMAVVGQTGSEVSAQQKKALLVLGVQSSMACISTKDFVTAGIMTKSCRRARELSAKQGSKKTASADMIRFFQEQEDLLKDVSAATLFKDVDEAKIAKPAAAA